MSAYSRYHAPHLEGVGRLHPGQQIDPLCVEGFNVVLMPARVSQIVLRHAGLGQIDRRGVQRLIDFAGIQFIDDVLSQ